MRQAWKENGKMTKGFLCTSTEPVVETTLGKLRGFRLDDIYHFYGIQYGKAGRFEQPVFPEKWEGVKDALAYGEICYPMHADQPGGDLFVPHRFWPKSENCLNLNIWTPSIEKDAQKPVMVWLHGGGMSDGSAIEMLAYDGRNLAEYGDVVVVTVNHRLNVFGFLNLSHYDELYHNSQNCGIADLVLALKWVHENIAAFGGNPDNVTIFGQSGGGKKVTSLMQVPSAAGLVHKAIIESGTGPSMEKTYYEDTSWITDKMLEEIGASNVKELVHMPVQELMELVNKVAPNQYWGPIENDWFGKTIYHGATEVSKSIPLLVGTNIGEFGSFGFSVHGRQNMTKEEKEQAVIARYGEEKGRKLLNLFYNAYPDHDALDAVVLDDGTRGTTLALCDLRAEQNAADTYTYVFAYDFPVDDGKAAWHCAEIPYVFRNMDRAAYANTEDGERLQDQFSGFWVNFARTGNPNGRNLPYWEPYTKEHEVTMIIDRECRTAVNYDKELIEYHKQLNDELKAPDMLM